MFALAHKASISPKPWTDKQPREFCMGTGHVIFWYDKLQWLSDRHQALTAEMLSRGYKPSYTGCLKDEWEGKSVCGHTIGRGYWKGYVVTDDALRVNRERIVLRTKKD